MFMQHMISLSSWRHMCFGSNHLRHSSFAFSPCALHIDLSNSMNFLDHHSLMPFCGFLHSLVHSIVEHENPGLRFGECWQRRTRRSRRRRDSRITWPLQSSAPIFAKCPLQERTQFCTTLPLTCDEDLFRDSRVYSWQLVCFQKKSLASFQILHAAMYQILRGAAILLRLLSTPEDLESRKLLVEIKQQPGVIDLSGPAVASTNVGTATEFLAEGWSTESVSRVARSARTKQGNSGQECAEQALCMYMQQDMPAFSRFSSHGTRTRRRGTFHRKDRTRRRTGR